MAFLAASRRLTLLGLCLLPLAGCLPKVIARKSDSESITPKGMPAGKWLATVSIGGGVPASALHLLRETLQETFGTELGGAYQVALQISDLEKPEGVTLDKPFVRSKFAELAASIAAFKTANPGVPTMVVLGMTGHGVEKDGKYTFAVENEETLTGTEIAQLVRSLGADETILIMQSCLSGNLANRDFPQVFAGAEAVGGLAGEVNRAAREQGVRLAVLTPASGYVSSPFFSWETILKDAIARAGQNGGGYVTYQQWKSEIMRAACSADDYYPQEAALAPRQTIKYYDMANYPEKMPEDDEAIRAGIDPQFHENIAPELPLFLTASGRQAWQTGRLALPGFGTLVPSARVEPEADVKDLCARKTRLNVEAVQANATTLANRLREGSAEERAIFARDLGKRMFTPAELLPVVKVILERETLPAVISSAYGVLARFDRAQLASLPLAGRLLSHLDIPAPNTVYPYEIYNGVLEAFDSFAPGMLDPFVGRITSDITNSEDGMAALPALQLLGKMRHRPSLPLLRSHLTNENMYFQMGSALGLVHARDVESLDAVLAMCESVGNVYAAKDVVEKLAEMFKELPQYWASDATKERLRRIRARGAIIPETPIRAEYEAQVDAVLQMI